MKKNPHMSESFWKSEQERAYNEPLADSVDDEEDLLRAKETRRKARQKDRRRKKNGV